MQTSTHSPTRATTTRKVVRSKPAVYPVLPDTDHPGFWLAVFLRDMAELDELNKTVNSKGFYDKAAVLCNAMHDAIRLKREDMKIPAGYTVQNGLLPFAHAHTTYFAQEGGAA